MTISHLILAIVATALALGGLFTAVSLGDPYAPAADRWLHLASLVALFAGGLALGWAL